MAASPIGTLIQKIERQPTVSVSRPPTIGPTPRLMPDHAAPDADRPGPFARLGEDVGDDRHRDRVEHRAADRLHHPEGDQPAQARRQAAQQRAER